MPDGHSERTRGSRRQAPAGPSEVEAIDALIDRLVPALTAKLGQTHLGELEVREGDWKIRLRRPATAGGWNGEARRSSDRHGARSSGAGDAQRVPTPGGSNGTSHGAATAGHAGPPGHAGGARADEPGRRVVTSPAVGVFRPNARATVGSRVREGDGLGHVDVLGVRQDVLAPADGLVAEVIVEGGTAVEFGQELLVMTLAVAAGASGSGAGTGG